MINESNFKNQFDQIKGDIRQTWSKLTPEDLEKGKSNLTSFMSTIQEKYNLKREDVSQKLETMLSKTRDSSSRDSSGKLDSEGKSRMENDGPSPVPSSVLGSSNKNSGNTIKPDENRAH